MTPAQLERLEKMKNKRKRLVKARDSYQTLNAAEKLAGDGHKCDHSTAHATSFYNELNMSSLKSHYVRANKEFQILRTQLNQYKPGDV